MFYLNYLKAELTRRWGKTLMISLGLAITSAIIITIISLSQSLSASQKKVLDPLSNVGTDIMVSRSVNTENMRDLDEATRTELLKQNNTTTDLSKLGNPGDQFSNDNFLTGTMLTFASTDASKLKTAAVKTYASGLILNVTHQEGKIPKVTSSFTAPGQTIDVNGSVSGDTMRAAFDAAQQKAADDLKAKGIDPNSQEGHQALREAIRANMPAQDFHTQVRTQDKTYTQDVGPISTDIKTENYTVAGVETTKSDIGLILPSQITSGKYFNAADQIVVNQTFADKKTIKVGDKFTLGGKQFTVSGLVDPKLYTNTADLYLPLADLQTLANRKDLINILLVKSSDNKNIDATSKTIAGLFTGAKVTNSKDTAKEVSGSLVSAANLTNKFIGITSIIIILAAFAIVGLLTILSVNKRTREIGTLKAIGWNNSLIVRQILMENIATGLIGAIIGIGLGVLGIYILNHYNISLGATIGSAANNSDGGPGGGFMRRFAGLADTSVKTSVPLKVTYSYLVLALGAGVALIGSILAGGLAAFKTSRMRAQEALRNLE